MTDHKQDNNHIDPSLMDTQRLLLGVDLPEDAPFDLDDILAEYGMNVIDSGVPVLNMHAPWEATSKADVYETYRGYIAFAEGAGM